MLRLSVALGLILSLPALAAAEEAATSLTAPLAFVTGFLEARLLATTVRFAGVLCLIRGVAARADGTANVAPNKVNAINALTDFDVSLALMGGEGASRVPIGYALR